MTHKLPCNGGSTRLSRLTRPVGGVSANIQATLNRRNAFSDASSSVWTRLLRLHDAFGAGMPVGMSLIRVYAFVLGLFDP